ncbi:hypothetical protein AZI11_12990 (plasmid) [Levilactobacillus brevis]|uniref:hypothetical protein n=1 Tax=Levilactobacillus brevis TaxID=1580 RepID=UPI000A20738C|nr:hypothetical protein [Levilactobacillus brevis]ARN93855.1 hypothetical protein AZI11_12990 [Levilactobacillus brevis]ARN96391.1 hypothetical protein AZI12_12860 [Levilactobacillus brevis]
MENISQEEAEARAARFFRNDYHDRGMLKWQGFFLSDHTSAIKKEAAQPVPDLRPEMNQLEIGSVLSSALESCAKVSVQINQVSGNGVPAELHGYVKGYQDDKICLSVKGNIQKISVDEIRNVLEY